MPMVRDGTLASALADHGAFSPELAATMLLHVLAGLEHVHAAGWLHRGVKPANILPEVTGTGHPQLRLGDFGSAQKLTDPHLTHTGYVHGTPGFMAPEALLGAPPSVEADLYAVGIVALRMLHPIVHDTGEALSALAHSPTWGTGAIPEPLRPPSWV